MFAETERKRPPVQNRILLFCSQLFTFVVDLITSQRLVYSPMYSSHIDLKSYWILGKYYLWVVLNEQEMCFVSDVFTKVECYAFTAHIICKESFSFPELAYCTFCWAGKPTGLASTTLDSDAKT